MTNSIAYSQISAPISVTTNVALLEGASAKVTVWLTPPRIVLISAVGPANPTYYPGEIYSALMKISALVGFPFRKDEVFLDLMHILGINAQYLYRWRLGSDSFTDSIEPVSFESLRPEVSSLLKSHLAERFGTLKAPGLTNDQKVDIVAGAIADVGLDECEIRRLCEHFGRQLTLESERKRRKALREYSKVMRRSERVKVRS